VATLSDVPSLRLTSLTDCGGCAPPDDAAAYRVSDDLAIIGTVDFFPPLVDDAWTFGEIAAANAMSDVFAMGGRVLFALSIAAFPEELPRNVLAEVFGGASAKVREAGGTLAGGHTIRDPEPKYGLAVIGAAHPDRLLRKGGARPGDQLLLTKPLGIGLLISGARAGRTDIEDLAAAIDQMRALNRAAAEILVEHGVTAATDITGFGLLGHALEMARASGARLTFDARNIPALQGALALARTGVETAGAAHNRRFVADDLRLGAGIPQELVTLAFDPQTSGGLLAAVDSDRVTAVGSALREAGVDAWPVGRIEAGGGVALA
jgi:selenide,water dikinase